MVHVTEYPYHCRHSPTATHRAGGNLHHQQLENGYVLGLPLVRAPLTQVNCFNDSSHAWVAVA